MRALRLNTPAKRAAFGGVAGRRRRSRCGDGAARALIKAALRRPHGGGRPPDLLRRRADLQPVLRRGREAAKRESKDFAFGLKLACWDAFQASDASEDAHSGATRGEPASSCATLIGPELPLADGVSKVEARSLVADAAVKVAVLLLCGVCSWRLQMRRSPARCRWAVARCRDGRALRADAAQAARRRGRASAGRRARRLGRVVRRRVGELRVQVCLSTLAWLNSLCSAWLRRPEARAGLGVSVVSSTSPDRAPSRRTVDQALVVKLPTVVTVFGTSLMAALRSTSASPGDAGEHHASSHIRALATGRPGLSLPRRGLLLTRFAVN